MNQQFDVLVVGGGVVGLTAALSMLSRGFSVALVDSGPLSVNLAEPCPRVYAVNQASQDLLQDLSVWPQLDNTRLSPYRAMYVWDATNNAHIEFDAHMVASENLGHILEESVLKQALLQRLSEQSAFTMLAHTVVTAVECSPHCITIKGDKISWQAKLLMVADGGNSPCRQLLNVPCTTWSYHQNALVALVHTEKAHQQTAYQVFNADGPLAFLPLVDEKQCSIVWSTIPARAKQLIALSEQDFNSELTTAFAGKLGQVRLEGPRYQFPLTMRHTKQYSGSRWLLLGDAAHTIHPLAGLGLNVGLADVATWLSCLDKGNNHIASNKVLGAYQRHRKHAVWQIIALMDGLKSLFTNPLPPVIALRNIGLRLCNRISPLKRILIEHAAGKRIN